MNYSMRLYLQRFAEGGAAAGAAAPTAAADAGQQQGGVATQSQAPAGEPAAPAAPTVAPDKGKTFAELISGEYKDEFGKEFQKRFDARHREAKTNAETLAKLQPAMERLAHVYGLEASDLDGIVAKVLGEKKLVEDAALREGKTTDTYLEQLNISEENARLRRAISEQRQQREMAEKQEKLRVRFDAEAKALVSEFPSADIGSLAGNQQFMRMVNAGVEMKAAYAALHVDELAKSTWNKAKESTAQMLANNVAANLSRPAEGGAAPAANVHYDVNNMTKAQRQELIRRARNGERITF